MARKTVPLNQKGIDRLPDNKPVVYKIRNRAGTNTYTGVAKRGRVAERLSEHMPGSRDHIPGAASVEITQYNSIAEAREAEARSIKRSKPKYNKAGN